MLGKAAAIGGLIALACLAPAQAQMPTGKPTFVGNVTGGSVPANFSTYWSQVTPENPTKRNAGSRTSRIARVPRSCERGCPRGAADTYNGGNENGRAFEPFQPTDRLYLTAGRYPVRHRRTAT